MIHCKDQHPGEGLRPLCPPEGRYIGHFDSLSDAENAYPAGGRRGWFFSNGETLSLWMWDSLSNAWHDTACADSTLRGIVDDPAAFAPDVRPGLRTAYLYVQPAPGTVTLARFLNGNLPVQVTVQTTALILLFWNGDLWEHTVTPFYVDMTPYALADLSNVARLADSRSDGLMPSADKRKLDALFPVTLDVDAARQMPVVSSRYTALGFLDGLSLADVVTACRRSPSLCLFYFCLGEGAARRTGSLGYAAVGEESQPLSMRFSGEGFTVCLEETAPGSSVQVRVRFRPADLSVAVTGGQVASYPLKAGYRLD